MTTQAEPNDTPHQSGQSAADPVQDRATAPNTDATGPATTRRAAHTPGPWSIGYVGSMAQAFGGAIFDKDRNQLALVTVLRDGSEVTREANAALIAASPALLEMCKALLPEIGGKEFVAGCVDDGISPELRRLWNLRNQLSAVIAQAEGRQS